MRASLTVKLLLVGFFVLLCTFPTILIQGLVEERMSRKAEANYEVAEKWGQPQLLAGPILLVPYTERITLGPNDVVDREGTLTVLPETLVISAELEPDIRSRGIFPTLVYTAKLNVQGSFAPLNNTQWETSGKKFFFDRAMLTVGLSDTRGIAAQPELVWGDRRIVFQPGSKAPTLSSNGIHTPVPVFSGAEALPFSFTVDMRGSDSLEFYPLGKDTTARVTSTWNAPSFMGAFLPEESTISNSGFFGLWKVSSFSRSFPQFWMNTDTDLTALQSSAFGVRLLDTVDFYTLVERATKYAILFIALTFLTFFLCEVLYGLRVHPIQYLLVGSALAIFYLLLLSLSEHIGFLPAYLVSTVATVGLITGYSMAMLKKRKFAWTVLLLLCALYTYLYVLLQLEEKSLLFGSLLLFAILGSVMYMTRNVDWYQLDKREERK